MAKPKGRENQKAKNWSRADFISLIAAIISVGALGVSIWVQRDLQWKWQLTEAGGIDVEDVSLRTFKRLKASELDLHKYGYNPKFLHDGNSDDYLLAHHLIAKDKLTGTKLNGVNGLSLDDINLMLKAAGKTLGEVDIKKEYVVNFKFRNSGRAAVEDFKVRVDLQPIQNRDFAIGNTGQVQEIRSGRTFYSVIQFESDINTPIPDEIVMRLSLSYRSAGKSVERISIYKYSTEVGGFREEAN